ncbi:Sphingomyelin phosphodiesterase-like [Oopsacas minuta]|uniref:Sphingomyelin phosphodiesterase n=1 Tax=Oopsacas minuta TaxID=111878 RepID=A0AAV7JVN1_9METZ|nr:Sphingomyelin phosphodiesterase-like [Oopsacas minuta]
MNYSLIVFSVIFFSINFVVSRPVLLDGHSYSHNIINNKVDSKLTCELCKAIFAEVQKLAEQGKTEDELAKIITDICIIFQLQDDNVCHLVVPEFRDEVLTVAFTVGLNGDEVCGIILGPTCGIPYDPFNQTWSVKMLNTTKPPIKEMKLPAKGAKQTRILHITDIHYDAMYTEGLSIDCGEPLCCRPPNKPNATYGAHKWGEFKCDLSTILLHNFMQKVVAMKNDYDVIYVTGDLPPHNVWNQSRDDQITAISYVINLFKTMLPNKKVYFAVGNHEGLPVNAFPPVNVKEAHSGQWLRDFLSEKWGNWLPEDTKQTIQQGIFYTTLVKPGLRIISLNMNYCNNRNWWLLINATDPAGQLQWLVRTLQSAEDKGERVHIIGHIPSGGGDCIKTWSWQYFKILLRYENTISAQFMGHTHNDIFTVYFDPNNITRPFSVLFTAGSVTPLTDLNPGFKIFSVDGGYKECSWGVLDFTSYYMDLMQVDRDDKPVWNIQYKASEVYGIQAGYPKYMSDLLTKFTKNDTLFGKYINYRAKSAPHSVCNASCKKSVLCEMRCGRSHDETTFCNLNEKERKYHNIRIQEELTC